MQEVFLEQFVVKIGKTKMLQLSALNWDSPIMVSLKLCF